MRGEVRAAFQRYEAALRAHDVASLNAFFVPGPDTVRYGVAEQQYGSDAIARWRAAAAPVHPGRELLKVAIAVAGSDCACVSAELRDPAHPGVLRQTQTWVRTVAGWRILAAHVSLDHVAPGAPANAP